MGWASSMHVGVSADATIIGAIGGESCFSMAPASSSTAAVYLPANARELQAAHVAPASSASMSSTTTCATDTGSQSQDSRPRWNNDQTFLLGVDGEEPKFKGKVRMLDVNQVSSVREAVDMLNRGSIECPEDFCVVYSSKLSAYYLLYRKNMRATALAKLGLQSEGRESPSRRSRHSTHPSRLRHPSSSTPSSSAAGSQETVQPSDVPRSPEPPRNRAAAAPVPGERRATTPLQARPLQVRTQSPQPQTAAPGLGMAANARSALIDATGTRHQTQGAAPPVTSPSPVRATSSTARPGSALGPGRPGPSRSEHGVGRLPRNSTPHVAPMLSERSATAATDSPRSSTVTLSPRDFSAMGTPETGYRPTAEIEDCAILVAAMMPEAQCSPPDMPRTLSRSSPSSSTTIGASQSPRRPLPEDGEQLLLLNGSTASSTEAALSVNQAETLAAGVPLDPDSARGVPAARESRDAAPWALGQTCWIGVEGEEKRFAGLARMLDRESVSSVARAVELLNRREIFCPEDSCIVFSASSAAYFLLYRCGCKETVLANMGMLGEVPKATTGAAATAAALLAKDKGTSEAALQCIDFELRCKDLGQIRRWLEGVSTKLLPGLLTLLTGAVSERTDKLEAAERKLDRLRRKASENTGETSKSLPDSPCGEFSFRAKQEDTLIRQDAEEVSCQGVPTAPSMEELANARQIPPADGVVVTDGCRRPFQWDPADRTSMFEAHDNLREQLMVLTSRLGKVQEEIAKFRKH